MYSPAHHRHFPFCIIPMNTDFVKSSRETQLDNVCKLQNSQHVPSWVRFDCPSRHKGMLGYCFFLSSVHKCKSLKHMHRPGDQIWPFFGGGWLHVLKHKAIPTNNRDKSINDSNLMAQNNHKNWSSMHRLTGMKERVKNPENTTRHISNLRPLMFIIPTHVQLCFARPLTDRGQAGVFSIVPVLTHSRHRLCARSC